MPARVLALVTFLALPLLAGASEKESWAFQPLRSPRPPEVRDAGWVRTPVDRFILARLEKAGLAPGPVAPRATLLRRVYLDLIGLPPTPEEVVAFENDPSPDAFARVVDRLLASPHYGERWGRHWLDLARYADSGGFHNDIDRPYAWRYRDYVIRAFNEDRPYGRFLQEQLAGDELAPGDPDAIVATGFLRHGPSNDDNTGAAGEDYRLEILDDTISTTAQVFLGLTLGCARCHDHKIDPLTQKDYYRFLAVFNNVDRVDVALDRLPGSLAEARKAGDISRKRGKSLQGPAVAMAVLDRGASARPTYLLHRGNVKMRGPEVEPGIPAVLASPTQELEARAGTATTGRRLALARWMSSPDNPLTWRVIANRVWQHHFGRGLSSTPSNFGPGGEPPTHPELLDWLASELVRDGGRLKALHRTILLSAVYQQSSRLDPRAARIDPENRLWSRQAVRRLEAEPIRDSILAIAGTLSPAMNGPGIKPRIPAELLTTSQRNRWPRIEREGPEHWRRSVYIYVKRQLVMPLMELLDAPSSALTCSQRAESTVPTQALMLLNGGFTNDQADHLARRVLAEAGPAPGAQARRILWLAFCRAPSPARLEQATGFLERQRLYHQEQGQDPASAARLALADLGVVLFNTSELLHVD